MQKGSRYAKHSTGWTSHSDQSRKSSLSLGASLAAPLFYCRSRRLPKTDAHTGMRLQAFIKIGESEGGSLCSAYLALEYFGWGRLGG